MWSPRLIKMWFYCWMVHFYCSIVGILLFSKLFTFKLKFGRWHIRTIGNSNVKSKIDKNVIRLLYGQFYCSIVRILLFSKLFTFKLKFGRWHIRTNREFKCEVQDWQKCHSIVVWAISIVLLSEFYVFKTFYI